MDALKTAINLSLRELDICFEFSWMDWSTTIIPSLIFSIGASRSSGSSPASLAPRYILLIFWNTSFIYFFNLLNQITGIVEDRVDKPHRPLPSGKVTLAGAKKRCMVVLLVWLLASIHSSVVPEMLCWTVTTGFLCLTAAGNHWFGKNTIGMTTGTWSLYSASWKIIAEDTEQSMRYAWTIAIWFAVAAHIQDLRDIAGDSANGRRTLPIVFGDRCSRWLITLIAMPLQILTLWLGRIAQIAPLLIGAAHAIIAWRVMQVGRGSKYDHKTYMVSYDRIVDWMTTDLDDSSTDLYLYILSFHRLRQFGTDRVIGGGMPFLHERFFWRWKMPMIPETVPHHDVFSSAIFSFNLPLLIRCYRVTCACRYFLQYTLQ